MPAQLNHTVVGASDAAASAAFLCEILDLPAPQRMGPFHVYDRVMARELDIWADPRQTRPGQINHDHGRGFYFLDPSGHNAGKIGHIVEVGQHVWSAHLNGMEGASMTSNQHAAERPTSVTVICVLMAIGAVVAVPLAFASKDLDLPGWYPPFLILSSLVGLVSMTGLWQMKRWGVYLYAGMLVVSQIVLIAGGLWTPLSIIAPLAYLAFLRSKLPLMT